MRHKQIVWRSGFMLHNAALFAAALLTTTLLIVTSITQVNAQERLKIVVSYSILSDIVQNVVGDAAEVTTLMPIGSDPHSYSPAPGDIVALSQADVVFVVGINFEQSLIESIEEAAQDMNIVEVSSCIPIIASGTGHAHDEHEADEAEEVEMAETVDAALAELCAAHDGVIEAMHADKHHDEAEADETQHEDEHSHAEVLGPLYTLNCGGHGHEDEESHQHGACDPHVWTDPHNVIYWTLMIRDILSELDPINAEIYAVNAAAYAVELDTLAHDFIIPLVESIPAERRILLTNHETLGYFAANYGFEIVGTVIPGSATLGEPSAAQIVALINLIRDEGVKAVFAENTVNARLAEQVAAESGAQFYTLYSDSLSEPEGPASTYLDYMQTNVTTIVQALEER